MGVPVDCLIVGFYEIGLDRVIDGYEKMRKYTGAYRHQLHAVMRFQDRWMSYTDVFNEIISAETGEPSSLHLMRMPNLAVCYLKSFLKKRGISAEIINFCNAEKERFESLLRSKPAAVAITTAFYVSDYPVMELIKYIKSVSPGSKVILGGPFVNNICLSSDDMTTQDYMFEKLGADIYINSFQGESTLALALGELKKGEEANLKGVPNLVYPDEQIIEKNQEIVSDMGLLSSQGKFIRTSLEVENNDLNENCIDWDFFPKNLFTPITFIRTARGCPFSCAFCNFPTMSGELTYTNIDVIEKEMEQLWGAGVRYLIFIDDSFNVPLSRFKKIMKMMIANGFQFKWISYFRCSHSDDETFDLMKQSGCLGVFLGIESGDQGILDNMNKQVSVDRYKTGIASLHERGIFTFISLIVGFPGETEQSVKNTVAFLEETRPTFMKAELYFHAHHVPVHREAEKYGIKGSGYGWRHNTMDWQTACDHLERMYEAVQNSLICPVYLFDFWTIPYFLSNGVSLDQFKRFLSLCKPLLLKNFNLSSESEAGEQYEPLYELGREIAQGIGK